jgi:hypothetical protein
VERGAAAVWAMAHHVIETAKPNMTFLGILVIITAHRLCILEFFCNFFIGRFVVNKPYAIISSSLTFWIPVMVMLTLYHRYVVTLYHRYVVTCTSGIFSPRAIGVSLP